MTAAFSSGGVALKDTLAFGMSLPHRSVDPIPTEVVRRVAQRANELGFQDLWVTNDTVDEAGCFDALIPARLCLPR